MLKPAQRSPGLVHVRLAALYQRKICASFPYVIVYEEVFHSVVEDSAGNFSGLFEFRYALAAKHYRQHNCRQRKDCMTESVHHLYNTAGFLAALNTVSSGKAAASSLMSSS